MMSVSLFILLNSAIQVFVMGAGIGLIVLIFSTVVGAGLKKADSVLNPVKDVSKLDNVDDVFHSARIALNAGRVEEAKVLFQRVIEMDPNCNYSWTMLGNLMFVDNKEMSFKGLQVMEQNILKEGKNFHDDTLKDFALNYYMLGHHYYHKNQTEKGLMFKNLATRNKKFEKEYAHFIKAHPY